MKKYDLVIVGGGASGMMMAVKASESGKKILILEKNKILGKKLSITGGGRCNITNAEFDYKKFLENFPESKKFLYSPFSKFSVKDTFSFFENLGLSLRIEARKRVFPESQKAADVVKVLLKELRKKNVEIRIGSEVIDFSRKHKDKISDPDLIEYVRLKNGEKIFADYFALATGGYAAPQTGSTGDGFIFLKKLGHKIHKPNPNIVPLTTANKYFKEIPGTTWSFIKISFSLNGEKIFSKKGKILFTHFGLSSPLILNSSYEVSKMLKKGKVVAHLDFFPDTDLKDLDKKILKLFEKNKNKKIKNVLPDLLNKKISEAILNHFQANFKEKKVNEINREERRKLLNFIKNSEILITGTLGMDKAVIADGGVDLNEVDFKDMTSKIYSNLFLLGDILNINRPSGGYSLQLCWTTGAVAAESFLEKAG